MEKSPQVRKILFTSPSALTDARNNLAVDIRINFLELWLSDFLQVTPGESFKQSMRPQEQEEQLSRK